MQRLIGNRATQRLLGTPSLQRDDSPDIAAPALLTPTQINAAKRYYTYQPEQFTPFMIQDLQGALGLPQTGLVDDALVLAVARFQENDPMLKTDGMAGPRTMAVLFPTGLAEDEAKTTFVGELRDIQERLDKDLDTPEKRAEALMAATNRRLEAADVPLPELSLETMWARGSFTETTWEMQVNPDILAGDVTHNELGDVARTFYHEARHAEQIFNILRLLAGQRKPKVFALHKTGALAEIVDLAYENPLAPDTPQGISAQGQYDYMYGKHEDKRDQIIAATAAAKRHRDTMCAAFDQNPTPANRARLDAAQANFEAKLELYHDMPHEFDAHYHSVEMRDEFGAVPFSTCPHVEVSD